MGVTRRLLVLALLPLLMSVASCRTLEPLTHTAREEIAFESLDFPGALWDPFMPPAASATTIRVSGMLTVPPTDVPVPAVVITHGCGGVSSSETGWVRELEAAGYATFLLRSFPARGVTGICTGEQTVNLAGMLVDAFRARDALASHPYVDGSRVAILGLSFGGRTALWTSMRRFQEMYDGKGFAAHLALYPSTCFIRLEGESDVRGGPIRIFHGTADDWTPIEQCQSYVRRLQDAGVDADMFAYEGARHAFDNATLPSSLPVSGISPRNCSFEERNGTIVDPDTGGVAGVGSPCVEAGVSIGYDPHARELAVSDLLGVLRDAFGQ